MLSGVRTPWLLRMKRQKTSISAIRSTERRTVSASLLAARALRAFRKTGVLTKNERRVSCLALRGRLPPRGNCSTAYIVARSGIPLRAPQSSAADLPRRLTGAGVRDILLRMSLKPTKGKSKQVKDAERRLRTFALRFPEVREDHPWGHSAFKVKGKTFLFMAVDAGDLSFSVKLPESGQYALMQPYASPTG